MKRKIALFSLLTTGLLLAGCAGDDAKVGDATGAAVSGEAVSSDGLNNVAFRDIESAVEGTTIHTLGAPEGVNSWDTLKRKMTLAYDVSWENKEMQADPIIALEYAPDGKRVTQDIAFVNRQYAEIAEQNNLSMKYKTSYWDWIPEEAKDNDGDWVIDCYGTTAMLINKKLVKTPPESFADILKGDYPVGIGDVGVSDEAQSVIIAASIANGGTENDIEPGLAYFDKLVSRNRLVAVSDPATEIENTGVIFGWDFDTLMWKDKYEKAGKKAELTVDIPQDGAITDGMATVINTNAQNPEGAALMREFMLSDEGQEVLVENYREPVRDNIPIPKKIKEKKPAKARYKNAKKLTTVINWSEIENKIIKWWQE